MEIVQQFSSNASRIAASNCKFTSVSWFRYLFFIKCITLNDLSQYTVVGKIDKINKAIVANSLY